MLKFLLFLVAVAGQGGGVILLFYGAGNTFLGSDSPDMMMGMVQIIVGGILYAIGNIWELFPEEFWQRKRPPASKTTIALRIAGSLIFLLAAGWFAWYRSWLPEMPENIDFIILHALAGFLAMIPFAVLCCVVMRRMGIR